MQEEMRLITFDPLWETMKKKGVTTYTLITKYSFSKGNAGRFEAQPQHHACDAQRHLLNSRLLCGGRHFIYSGREIADIEFQNSIPAISFIKQEKELGFLPAPFLRLEIIRTAP